MGCRDRQPTSLWAALVARSETWMPPETRSLRTVGMAEAEGRHDDAQIHRQVLELIAGWPS